MFIIVLSFEIVKRIAINAIIIKQKFNYKLKKNSIAHKDFTMLQFK